MTEMRKCIGSAKFGIEGHQAPAGDFPRQPSQKDGLGRMCKPHWTEYTRGLARDRKARAGGEPAPASVKVERARRAAAKSRGRKAQAPKPEAIKVRRAKAIVAATEALAGEAHLEAVGSDEVQAALEVIASERVERIIT